MTAPGIEVRGLCAARGGRPAIVDLSFRAEAGEVFAIVGPNGAGKTTLLETLVGLAPADAGEVHAGGTRLRSFADRARVFAFMPDEARLAEEATVRTLVGTEARKPRIEGLLDRRGDELSRGEAKRVFLAWALSLERPVLVLDEPFAAFDPLELDAVLEVVRAAAAEGTTVIATVHQLSVAERIADRLLLLAGGRAVASGTLDDLRARAALPGADLEAVFRALMRKGPDAPA